MHSWSNLILALIAFGLAASAASFGTKRDGLFAEPGRPDPGETGAAAPRDPRSQPARADQATRWA
jgi:hypothetical protein